MDVPPSPRTTASDLAPRPSLHLAHVALTTSDVDRLHRFYVDVVGLELHDLEAPLGAPYRRVATYGGNGSARLVAYEVPGFAPVERARRGSPSVDHLAFRCADPSALYELERRLRAAGRIAGEITEDNRGRTVPFTDPDGIDALAMWTTPDRRPPTY